MVSDWEDKRLDELTELIIDCPHSTPKWTNEGVRVLRSNNIKNGRLDLSNPSYTNEEGYQSRIKRAIPEEGDVVLTREAPMGEVCKIPSGLRCCLGQRMVLLRTKKESLDSSYLLYVLQSPYLKHQISWNEGTGTTVSNIRIPNIKAFKIPTPSLSEQKAIAHILGSLDEKIQLNRQMNETLESMTQALFKSWFVNFDPVIDNALAAGNPIPDVFAERAEKRKVLSRGIAETTSEHSDDSPQGEVLQKPHKSGGVSFNSSENTHQSLFPSEFEFTEETGWIPKGWELQELGSCLDVLETGRRPKGGVAKYKTGTPSVGAESIKGIGNFEFGKTKYIPNDFFEKMKSGIVKDYDVLLYKDGGKPGDFKPRIGMFGNGFPFKDFAINEHVFRVRSDKLGQPFLYYQLSSDRIFHDLSVRGGKAAIPGINQTEVKTLFFLIPSSEILEIFNRHVETSFETILKQSSECLTLSKLRDTLLPKLLSGELRIPDAEKLIKEAGV